MKVPPPISKPQNPFFHKLTWAAVILNEHLTKALRLLKRASPSSTVDKQVITNFLIQFLCLPREDTKRFEILNLISSLLEWNEEQRQKAGLQRSTGTKESGFRRSSSNPMLSDFPTSPGFDRKEVRPRSPHTSPFSFGVG
jgi:GRAB domain